MKLSFFLSAGATFLLAAAAADEPALAEALEGLKSSGGIKHLANDGVLRSLNAARDTVVDYVQLNKRQIAEYFNVIDKDGSFMSGVDGRAVTSEAQLWAVPDTIVARTPNVKSSENIRVPSALIAGRLPDCNIGKTCNQDDDCPEWNCVQCVGADSPGPCMNGACPPVSPDGGCHGQL